jgi:RpiR family transcriptional regulator, carbohydrate utilization regulator
MNAQPTPCTMIRPKRRSQLKPTANSARPTATSITRRPLLIYLQAVRPSLHSTERLMADYILADPERMLSLSISDFRSGSGASVGSIVAFCKSLGLSGFTDFKITLAGELAHGGLSALQKTAREPAGASLFRQVFDFHDQSLKETLNLNSVAHLEQAARLMGKARKIEFFSIGMSYPVAYTACAKLKLIGISAGTECDSHLQLIRATQLHKGDVAFAISCSGSTHETVRCLEIAREHKATTLCLTNCVNSPITKQADLTLFAAPSEIKYFQAPLAARITQLALVDALFVAIALNQKKQTMAQLRRAGIELLEHRLGRQCCGADRIDESG